MNTTQYAAGRAGELSLHAWLVQYIQRQRFVESLEWIAEQIRLDTEDGAEYTQNAASMQTLRDAWASQMAFARSEQ